MKFDEMYGAKKTTFQQRLCRLWEITWCLLLLFAGGLLASALAAYFVPTTYPFLHAAAAGVAFLVGGTLINALVWVANSRSLLDKILGE